MYRVALWLTLLGLLAVAGCGGGSKSAAPGAEIPRGVAQNLAAQADAIAAAYESGDVCGAAHQADGLFNDVTAAIEGGDVPTSLQDTLLETAQKLQDDINCPEPTTTAAQDCGQLEEERQALEEQAKDTKGKGKGKKRQLDEQIKQLDELIKACREENGE